MYTNIHEHVAYNKYLKIALFIYIWLQRFEHLGRFGRTCHVTQHESIHWSNKPKHMLLLFPPYGSFTPQTLNNILPNQPNKAHTFEKHFLWLSYAFLIGFVIVCSSRSLCVGLFCITFRDNGVSSPSALTARYRIRSERDRDASVLAARCNGHSFLGTGFPHLRVCFPGAAATTAAPSAPQPRVRYHGQRVRFGGHGGGSGSVQSHQPCGSAGGCGRGGQELCQTHARIRQGYVGSTWMFALWNHTAQ